MMEAVGAMDRADAHHRGVVLYAAFRHPGRCSEVNQIRGKLPGICPAALTQHMVRATCIAEVVDTVQDLRADVVLVHANCAEDGKVLMEDEYGKVRCRFLKRRLVGELAKLARPPQLVFFNGDLEAADHAAASPLMSLAGMRVPVSYAAQTMFLLAFLSALLQGASYMKAFRGALSGLPEECEPVLVCGKGVRMEQDGMQFCRR